MKKKIKIHNEFKMPEGIYGISSQYNDYQLAWEINNQIHINLSKSSTDFIEKKQIEDGIDIILYSYKDAEDDYHYLIKNKYIGFNFIPKLNAFDYLLLVDKKQNEICKRLTINSSSKIILACFEISLSPVQLNIIKKTLLK